MGKDYYKILGVERNATDKNIRQAYRDLTRDLQNASPGDLATQERLNQVNEAYQVLSDPDDRRQYDALAEPAPVENPSATPTGEPLARTEPLSVSPVKRKRSVIPGVFVNILVLVVGVAIGFVGRPFVIHEPTQQEKLVQAVMAQTRHFKGNDNAPVTIIEFGDFQ